LEDGADLVKERSPHGDIGSRIEQKSYDNEIPYYFEPAVGEDDVPTQ